MLDGASGGFNHLARAVPLKISILAETGRRGVASMIDDETRRLARAAADGDYEAIVPLLDRMEGDGRPASPAIQRAAAPCSFTCRRVGKNPAKAIRSSRSIQ